MPAPKTKSVTATTTTTTATKSIKSVVPTGLPLVNKEKAVEAINSIIKYFKEKQSIEPLNILEENQKILINFETDKFYHNILFKPYHIVAPYQIEELSSKRTLVLIHGTKENAIDLKTKLVELQYNGAVDILSMKEFKKLYVTPELKIKVRKQYDEFVVDTFYKQKIQNLFGKEFYLSNQSPKKVEIDLENPIKLIETLKQLDRMVLVRSFKDLFFSLPIGTSDLSSDKLVENVAFIVSEIASKLPENIKSIQSLSIQGSDIRLPFYVNVQVPSNILFNSKKNLVELPPQTTTDNNTPAPTTTTTTTTTTTPTKNNKKRTEPETPITKEQTPIKETPNKKSKSTPTKEVKEVVKATTPVKEAVKSTTTTTPIKSKTPVKETPAPVVEEPIVTPSKPTTTKKSKTPAKETPVKETKEVTKVTTPAKSTPAVKETPVKETKAATPTKEVTKVAATKSTKPAAATKKVAAATEEKEVAAPTKVVKKTTTTTTTTTTAAKKTETTAASKLKKPVVKRA